MPSQYSVDSKLGDIKHTSVNALVPFANNARTHSEQQVAQIAASIREFGFTNPVLTDGDNGIIAGHGRVLAAKLLGLETVPTIELAHLTKAQRKAYVIADNKLALNAGWDIETLKAELEGLKELDYDLGLTGFSKEEMSLMGMGVQEVGFPSLPEGDKPEFQQMAFTLHDTQAEKVAAAMDAAKAIGPFIDSPNENSNGNALSRICETYLADVG
jgi:ParB family transcriptional regulator, chromosome partitioning protein